MNPTVIIVLFLLLTATWALWISVECFRGTGSRFLSRYKQVMQSELASLMRAHAWFMLLIACSCLALAIVLVVIPLSPRSVIGLGTVLVSFNSLIQWRVRAHYD